MLSTDYANSHQANLIASLRNLPHYVRQDFGTTDPTRAIAWHYYTPEGVWLASIRWSQTKPTEVTCSPYIAGRMKCSQL